MSSALALLLRRWPFFALIASAAMLAIAHAFQTFGGLAPCTLCLRQREVYWLALGVAAAATLVALTPAGGVRLRAASCLSLGLIFLVGAAVAGYHAGAEWKWWPGPTTCSAGGGASASALAALLQGARVGAPRCDQAAWVWLGLSMAGWNCLISIGLAALSALAAARTLTYDRP